MVFDGICWGRGRLRSMMEANRFSIGINGFGGLGLVQKLE
jgi:hypothetical protein